jgi:hypothetical protein
LRDPILETGALHTAAQMEVNMEDAVGRAVSRADEACSRCIMFLSGMAAAETCGGLVPTLEGVEGATVTEVRVIDGVCWARDFAAFATDLGRSQRVRECGVALAPCAPLRDKS